MVPIRATYRLQLHAGFPLSRVRALVPYLSKLGISHIHCSPMLQARKGSTHGYDVTNPSRLNPELGTEEDLAGLVADLRARDMGLVLDIVPNHMAASRENPAWEDVLTHGPGSSFARWFDVEWRAAERELRFRVLLPILGEQRSRVLQNDEIALAVEDGLPRVRYFEHSFPLDPSTLPPVLERAIGLSVEAGWGEDPSSRDLRDISMRLRRMPRRSNRRPAALARRRQIAATELHRLRELTLNDRRISEVVSAASAEFGSGSAGVERLRRLLDAQVYRLVYWRRGARELNYRRFFDVNDLVALHMEDPEVFAQTHALVLQWRQREWIDGFRIDHPDGLLDPLEYFRRLTAAGFPELSGRDPPIFVEKILAPGEQLRVDWPVAGTTGYDFLNQAENLYLDPSGVAEVEQEYRRIIRQPLEFGAIARLAKRRALESGLSAGVRRLAERLLKLAGPDRPLPSVTAHALSVAIVETIASLPVYRTYLDPSTPVAEGEDRRLLEAALSDARARGRVETTALDLLAAALLGLEGPMRTPEVEGLRLRFVQRFQQLSGPAMAKGVEDTAFYSFAPLLSRNEVGGSPESSLADAVGEFHRECGHRASRWPRALLAATTHDTKRSADVRSRLDVLSEIPGEWKAAVERWQSWNQALKRTGADRRDPDPGTVYHVLQALVGIWPAGTGNGLVPDAACLAELRDRLTAYAIKAVREAKVRTNWTDPDQEFEDALQAYIDAILCPERSARFLEDLSRFVARVALPGMWNGLSRTLLQLTAPGIPDIYQGDELWKLALVDPDNRRPVDFDRRTELLEKVWRIESGERVSTDAWRRLVESPEDGRIKLYLVLKALNARRSHPDVFLSGSYERLEVEGSGSRHLLGYAREWHEQRAVILAPRLLADLLRGPIGSLAELELWQHTAVRLPADWPVTWRCELSGEQVEAEQGTIPVSQAFRRLPLSLLVA